MEHMEHMEQAKQKIEAELQAIYHKYELSVIEYTTLGFASLFEGKIGNHK